MWRSRVLAHSRGCLLHFDRSFIKASKEVEAFYKSISHGGKCGYDEELDPKTLRPVNPCDASMTLADHQTHEALRPVNPCDALASTPPVVDCSAPVCSTASRTY